MTRTVLVVMLLVLPCLALAQEQDAVGTYIGTQVGVRGGKGVTLTLMPGWQASVVVAQPFGSLSQESKGTWRLDGPGFLRIDIAGWAGSGTLYFHRQKNLLVATMDPFKLGGLPLQLQKLEPVEGTYYTVRAGEGGYQRLTLQINQDQTAALTLEQNDQTTCWKGKWETLASGDVQLTLDTDGKQEKMVFTRDGGILRASQWHRSIWGNSSIVFTRS